MPLTASSSPIPPSLPICPTAMTPLQNRHQSQNPTPKPTRGMPAVLLAGALGTASLIATPVQAANQYCNQFDGTKCATNTTTFLTGDTYFWAPSQNPATAPSNSPLTITIAANNLRSRITLRSPSGWTLNAAGTGAGGEILIGSLGKNNLKGGGGNDTYVVGNEPATIVNLANCTSPSGNTTDCVFRQSPSSEADTITLNAIGTEVIYVNRCLQVTALGTPGLGGNQLSSATAAPGNLALTPPYPAYSGADASFVASCPTPIALKRGGLWTSAVRERDALLAPWERLGAASTALSQAFSWLEQTMTALIQGPRALAQSLPGKVVQVESKVPSFAGVPRLIQSMESNFLRTAGDRGDIIAVDGSAMTFNDRPLSSIRNAGRVYSQLRNSDPIPLNQGLVFIYHQQMGILAAYRNDRYPYGTKQNPGSVIAQLVLRDGRALPAGAIDSVVTVPVSGGKTPKTHGSTY